MMTEYNPERAEIEEAFKLKEQQTKELHAKKKDSKSHMPKINQQQAVISCFFDANRGPGHTNL